MAGNASSSDALRSAFADPPAEYGPYPGWWWEGAPVCREKLTWQLEEMKKVGTAGTFFYLRLTAPELYAGVPAYGSDEFLELFRHALQEHRRLGMQAFFSEWTGARGVADQILSDPDASKKLAGQRLVLHEQRTTTAGPVRMQIPPGQEAVSAAAYRLLPGRHDTLDPDSRLDLLDTVDAGGRLRWQPPDDDAWLVAFITSEPHSIDWLNPGVADHLVAKLWGPYLERMPEFIGNTFKGYVQDEMDVLQGDIVYSATLLERFVADKSYDPRPELAALFHDIGRRTDKVRCDYYEIMSALLEENVYARLSQWHEERNMLYGTIAVRGRQDALAQTSHFGDIFSLLRWYHFPGNEDPQLDPTVPRRRRFADAKLSSSAAHIFERERAAVCTYWGAGWGMTMEQRIAWTRENIAYGLNLYDPHLASYSLAGSWYEWVPPAQYFYQPHWRHYGVFSDYIRRLSYLMSRGTHVADVAILFPTTTLHANWLQGDCFTLDASVAASAVYDMAADIYDGGIDFDFVDDATIARAEVRDGKLCVAGLEFRAVVLPPLTTIRLATLEKLRALYDAGGIVLAYGRLPNASAENGRDDPQLREALEAIFGVESSDALAQSTSALAVPREDYFFTSILARGNAHGGSAILLPGVQNSDTNGSVCDLPIVLSRLMTPDVSAEDGDLFHIHRRAGDRDIYFLYNTSPQARSLEVTFRIDGEPEIWDAMTGEVRPYHRFERRDGKTTLRLRMARHEGLPISFSTPAGRPAVVADNMEEIIAVTPGDESIEVHGTCTDAGMKRVRVLHDGRVYEGEARVDAPPDPIALGGEWEIRLEPTMDNRWGDYRHPATERLIGAEARRFRYMEEGDAEGTALGWHVRDFDDTSWPRFTFSFGPYWKGIGPFADGDEPADLPAKVAAGQDVGTWTRRDFSMLYGHESKWVHQHWGGIMGVMDGFLAFDAVSGGRDATRYLRTTVCAPADGEWDLIFGGAEPFARCAWVNGEEVLTAPGPAAADVPALAVHDPARMLMSPHSQVPPATSVMHVAPDHHTRARVTLKTGPNTVLLRLVQPRGERIRAFAAFVAPGAEPSAGLPPIPRLRWFIEPTGLVYDIRPDAGKRVGWYRFEAPAGTRAIVLTLDATGAEAWIDGEPIAARDGRIELAAPKQSISQVALRIEQKPGCYAGAAIPEPVAFECERGRIPLGDWCDHALESYSGGVVYRREFTLEPRHLEGRALLDLGRVHVSAGVRVNGRCVGVGLTRPFRFDISEYVREGANELEVTVYNTLANHFSVGIPSRFVYDGQTESGLLGPVTVDFERAVRHSIPCQTLRNGATSDR